MLLKQLTKPQLQLQSSQPMQKTTTTMEEPPTQESTTICSLPAETILQICSYLSQKDVASFRLTSKCHAECGQERLVMEVCLGLETFNNFVTDHSKLHLMFRPKSFQNLLKIATHPVFPKYVHPIFYEVAIPHFGVDRDIWSHHAADPRRILPHLGPLFRVLLL